MFECIECDICGDTPVLYSCVKPNGDGNEKCDFDICENCYVNGLQVTYRYKVFNLCRLHY